MQSLQAPLDALTDAPRNANRMPPAKYAALLDSIKRVGFIVPIVITLISEEKAIAKWQIVDGHHRVRALRELGYSHAWAIELAAGEDPRLVALALNRLRGETDLAVAAIIVDELIDAGAKLVDLSIAGFSERELQDLLEAAQPTDDVSLDDLADADVPDEVGTPVAKPYLLDLQFRSKEDLASCRKALRKAAGKGADLSDGLLRLVRGEA